MSNTSNVNVVLFHTKFCLISLKTLRKNGFCKRSKVGLSKSSSRRDVKLQELNVYIIFFDLTYGHMDVYKKKKSALLAAPSLQKL